MPVSRLALAADAARLAELAERTFRDTFAASNDPRDMDQHCASAYGPAIQQRELTDATLVTFVVEREGRLVAYAQLHAGRTAPCPLDVGTPVQLRRFYLERALHGSGLAAALMAEVLAHARDTGADGVWLGVWEHNPRAIAFYAKHGFTVVGAESFLLGRDPQRDLIMARRL